MNFPTVGPHGASFENINGLAVAIECFLDLSDGNNERRVRWTSFNNKLKKYQGELECKDDLVKRFKTANLLGGSYDTSRLESLLDHIVGECINGLF